VFLTVVVNRCFLEISDLGWNDLCESTSLSFSSFTCITTNSCGDPGAAVCLFSHIWISGVEPVSSKNKNIKLKKKKRLEYKVFRLSVWVQGPSKGFGA